jgi:hypothetical protein
VKIHIILQVNQKTIFGLLFLVTFSAITSSIMIRQALLGGGFGEKKKNKQHDFDDFCRNIQRIQTFLG